MTAPAPEPETRPDPAVPHALVWDDERRCPMCICGTVFATFRWAMLEHSGWITRTATTESSDAR